MYEEADAEFLQIRALNSSTTSCASGGKQRYVDVYKVRTSAGRESQPLSNVL